MISNYFAGTGITRGPSTSIVNVHVHGNVQNSHIAVGGHHGSITNIQNDVGAIQTALEKAINQTLEQKQIEFLESNLQQSSSLGLEQKASTLAGLDVSLLNSLITFKKAQMSICMMPMVPSF